MDYGYFQFGNHEKTQLNKHLHQENLEKIQRNIFWSFSPNKNKMYPISLLEEPNQNWGTFLTKTKICWSKPPLGGKLPLKSLPKFTQNPCRRSSPRSPIVAVHWWNKQHRTLGMWPLQNAGRQFGSEKTAHIFRRNIPRCAMLWYIYLYLGSLT